MNKYDHVRKEHRSVKEGELEQNHRNRRLLGIKLAPSSTFLKSAFSHIAMKAVLLGTFRFSAMPRQRTHLCSFKKETCLI